MDLTRRRLLQTGPGGAALLAFGWVLPSGCARYSAIERPLRFLTRKEYAVVTQAAVRILGLSDDDRDSLGGFIDGLLAELPPTSQGTSAHDAAGGRARHPSSSISSRAASHASARPSRTPIFAAGWRARSALRRVIFRALKTLAALGHYAQTASFAGIGYDGPWLGRIEATSRVTHEAPVDLATVPRGAREPDGSSTARPSMPT